MGSLEFFAWTGFEPRLFMISISQVAEIAGVSHHIQLVVSSSPENRH
jgi:hypothetical protein